VDGLSTNEPEPAQASTEKSTLPSRPDRQGDVPDRHQKYVVSQAFTLTVDSGKSRDLSKGLCREWVHDKKLTPLPRDNASVGRRRRSDNHVERDLGSNLFGY
jgi:hypothetical protein